MTMMNCTIAGNQVRGCTTGCYVSGGALYAGMRDRDKLYVQRQPRAAHRVLIGPIRWCSLC